MVVPVAAPDPRRPAKKSGVKGKCCVAQRADPTLLTKHLWFHFQCKGPRYKEKGATNTSGYEEPLGAGI